MLLKKLLGEVPMTYSKGGKGGGSQAAARIIAAAPPVEEAGVEVDDDGARKRLKTSKKSLKMPLAETVNAGLKV